MKKAVLGIVVAIFIVLSGYFVLVFLDTNSLIYRVEELFRGEIPEEVTEGTAESRYNYSDQYETLYHGEVAEVEVSINRIFVLHNFNDGYVLVNYSHEARDGNDRTLCGSWDIQSLWKIHKEDGVWHIVSIQEAP